MCDDNNTWVETKLWGVIVRWVKMKGDVVGDDNDDDNDDSRERECLSEVIAGLPTCPSRLTSAKKWLWMPFERQTGSLAFP
jgi:hypothetical protein